MSVELIYGRNPVYEVLRAGRRVVHRLNIEQGVGRGGRVGEILALAAEKGVGVSEGGRRERMDSANTQGVTAEVSLYPYVSLDRILARSRERHEAPFVLLLDVLQDPQNLATLLRTAEVFGVHGVVIPPRRSASVTPAVVNASSGASEHLLIARMNLAQAIRELKEAELWISGLETGAEARTLSQADLTGPVGLVVGSESEGMRRLVRESCDFLVRIPMRGQVDSLNAATAGSIGLYAVWAARGFAGIDAPADS